MKISCGFAEAIVPNVFSLAELYLVYLAYQIMCLLFDGRAKAARAVTLARKAKCEAFLKNRNTAN